MNAVKLSVIFTLIFASLLIAGNGVNLENDKMKLGFAPAENGFNLVELTQLSTNHNFLHSAKSPLWSLTFKSGTRLINIDASASADRSHSITESEGKTVLNLFYKNISVSGSAPICDVHVTVKLNDKISLWNIDIKTRAENFGLWSVTFPVIDGLKASPADNMALAHPRFLGTLYKEPIKKMPLSMLYPSYKAEMQFSCLYQQPTGPGLYFAAHDPQALQKYLTYEKSTPGKTLKFFVKNYPENTGLPGTSYKMPYDVAVAAFEGDWQVACDIYKPWAVKQKWCGKGKVENRRDIPDWLKRTSVWFAGPLSDDMIPLAKFLDVPTAYHWYKWYDFSSPVHDDPDYFDFLVDDFEKKVTKIQNAGIRVMPYINSRLWALPAKSWKTGVPLPYTAKAPFAMLDNLHIYQNQDLTFYREHWGPNKQAVMCPYTNFWQNVNADICATLAGKYHCDGVYMDQIASFYPCLCFDPNHGHPVGGVAAWVDGNRILVQKTNRATRKQRPDAILTTEDHAEPFIDVFDALLTVNSVTEAHEMIPMYKYVYAGYFIGFGMMHGDHWNANTGDQFNTHLPFVMRNALMFTWGIQLGWFDPSILKVDSPEAQYLKTLAKAALGPARKFSLYGEMLKSLKLTGDNPILTAPWRAGKPDTKLPAVLNYIYKANDGHLGLLFTNMDSKEHEVSFEVDLAKYLSDAKSYRVSELIDKGKNYLVEKSTFSKTYNFPPYSAVVLEICADKQ